MNTIFVRSPFFITVNEAGQVGSKIELYIWNNPDTIPLTPTYTLSKYIVSPTQTENIYNISNYCAEYIKPIYPFDDEFLPKPENGNNYCNVLIKRYWSDSRDKYNLIEPSIQYIAVEGYTNYLGGYNQLSTLPVVPLFNPNIKLNLIEGQEVYINALFDVYGASYTWTTGVTEYEFEVLDYPAVIKLPIAFDPLNPFCQITGNDTNIIINLAEICEVKYTPVICSFINRFGGWSFINFFKAQTNSIEVKGSEYNLLSKNLDYNVHQGQSKALNTNGIQKVKLNTGWIAENYSELIQDLLLSETVLLDNKPAKVSTKSTNLKTSLRDKNINYEIDFEYAFNLINNAI